MQASEVHPPGRPIVERYGPGGFRINGVTFTGPVLVFPDLVLDWQVGDIGGLTPDDFRPVVEHGGIEILLLGTGLIMHRAPKPIRDALRLVGIVLDAMDTGAACRTHSVLTNEERRVAAALLPMR